MHCFILCVFAALPEPLCGSALLTNSRLTGTKRELSHSESPAARQPHISACVSLLSLSQLPLARLQHHPGAQLHFTHASCEICLSLIVLLGCSVISPILYYAKLALWEARDLVRTQAERSQVTDRLHKRKIQHVNISWSPAWSFWRLSLANGQFTHSMITTAQFGPLTFWGRGRSWAACVKSFCNPIVNMIDWVLYIWFLLENNPKIKPLWDLWA